MCDYYLSVTYLIKNENVPMKSFFIILISWYFINLIIKCDFKSIFITLKIK